VIVNNGKLKKVIITGVNGFIGGALADFCLKKGFDVIGIDITSESKVAGIIYYQMNLMNDDITGLLAYFAPDFFIHCAGAADVNYSVEHPDSDLFSNVVMTHRILYQILAAETNCRFIYMSSAAVYGQPCKLPIAESDRLDPISPYALHKQMGEEMCLYFIKQHKMDIKILRIFSVYGPGLRKQIFWDMGKKITQTKALELYGTGEESRDYIYISDLVNAIFCVMTHCFAQSETIMNIASGTETKIKQAAKIFVEKWGGTSDIINFSNVSRKGNPANWRADVTQLNKLGFKCSITIEKGIEEYIGWFKDEYEYGYKGMPNL